MSAIYTHRQELLNRMEVSAYLSQSLAAAAGSLIALLAASVAERHRTQLRKTDTTATPPDNRSQSAVMAYLSAALLAAAVPTYVLGTRTLYNLIQDSAPPPLAPENLAEAILLVALPHLLKMADMDSPWVEPKAPTYTRDTAIAALAVIHAWFWLQPHTRTELMHSTLSGAAKGFQPRYSAQN